MVKKVYYEKIGRKYVPVAEYDSEYLDSFPKGNHLVSVYPGGQSRRFNVDPSYAPMIAAGRVAEDIMSKAISDATEIRRQKWQSEKRELTPKQRKAWNNLVKELGVEARTLEWASAREVAEAGVKAMQEEAMKLMENPAVKNAYDQFLLICELTKDEKS